MKGLRSKERSAWRNLCFLYFADCDLGSWQVKKRGFDKFIADVGRCPGFNYYVTRKDELKPHGPGNTYWQAMPSTVKSPRHLGRPTLYDGDIGSSNKEHSNTKKEYAVWSSIKHKAKVRGESFHEEWLTPPEGFVSFLNDVGRKPPRLVFSKIDLDKPYEPENVEWVTKKESLNRYWAWREKGDVV